jgi:hypothetical protein
MKRFAFVAGALMMAQSAMASQSCFQLGKDFALLAAADYCGVAFSKQVKEDEYCFSGDGARDFEAGCENYVIRYVKDFYRDRLCEDHKKILKKKTREYVFKKRSCDI